VIVIIHRAAVVFGLKFILKSFHFSIRFRSRGRWRQNTSVTFYRATELHKFNSSKMSSARSSASAPYRKKIIKECFKIDIDRNAFFDQAADAVGNFVRVRDGAVSRSAHPTAGDAHDAVLLRVGEKGTILQKRASFFGANMKASKFMRQYGFKAKNYDCRLYDARMRPIDSLRPESLLQTAWSKGLPVMWILTERSVFMTPQKVCDGVRFNMSSLYTIPFGTLAYMYRNEVGAPDDEEAEDETFEEQHTPERSIFKRLETDAFSCEVYTYYADVRKCVLSEPNPRWPITKPRSLNFQGVQGRIAQATSAEFQKFIMVTFLDLEDDSTRAYHQLALLLTLEEEELSELLRRVPYGLHAYCILTELLRAPWIVTRNMYFARRGTVLPLGVDTFRGGHTTTEISEHLGRRVFMVPDRKEWEKSENRVYRKWNGIGPMRTVPDPDRKVLKGEELVLSQRENAMDARLDFDVERREILAKTPPRMNLCMVISSFSFARVELHRVKHNQRPTQECFEEGLSDFAEAIQNIISLLTSRQEQN